jgi:transposase
MPSKALSVHDSRAVRQQDCSAQEGFLEGRMKTGGDEQLLRKELFCSGCGGHWHRDVNAARNVRTLLCCRLV